MKKRLFIICLLSTLSLTSCIKKETDLEKFVNKANTYMLTTSFSKNVVIKQGDFLISNTTYEYTKVDANTFNVNINQTLLNEELIGDLYISRSSNKTLDNSCLNKLVFIDESYMKEGSCSIDLVSNPSVLSYNVVDDYIYVVFDLDSTYQISNGSISYYIENDKLTSIEGSYYIDTNKLVKMTVGFNYE